MISKTVTIQNPSGLHLRPAGILCKEATKFHSNISIVSKGVTANAKSLLSVLAASVRSGETIEVICDGGDENVAMASMIAVIESGLEDN